MFGRPLPPFFYCSPRPPWKPRREFVSRRRNARKAKKWVRRKQADSHSLTHKCIDRRRYVCRTDGRPFPSTIKEVVWATMYIMYTIHTHMYFRRKASLTPIGFSSLFNFWRVSQIEWAREVENSFRFHLCMIRNFHSTAKLKRRAAEKSAFHRFWVGERCFAVYAAKESETTERRV